METQNPYQYQQEAVHMQQERVADFMADNPGIDINEPSPPDPRVEVFGEIPPEANIPLEAIPQETDHPTRRGFHEIALTGLAVAGGVLATASFGVEIMEEAYQQDIYQEKQRKITTELARITEKQKKQVPGRRKTALGVAKENVLSSDSPPPAIKPPTPSLVPAA